MSPGSLGARRRGRPEGTTKRTPEVYCMATLDRKPGDGKPKPDGWRVAARIATNPMGERHRRLADAHEQADSSRCSAAPAPAAPPWFGKKLRSGGTLGLRAQDGGQVVGRLDAAVQVFHREAFINPVDPFTLAHIEDYRNEPVRGDTLFTQVA